MKETNARVLGAWYCAVTGGGQAAVFCAIVSRGLSEYSARVSVLRAILEVHSMRCVARDNGRSVSRLRTFSAMDAACISCESWFTASSGVDAPNIEKKSSVSPLSPTAAIPFEDTTSCTISLSYISTALPKE